MRRRVYLTQDMLEPESVRAIGAVGRACEADGEDVEPHFNTGHMQSRKRSSGLDGVAERIKLNSVTAYLCK